MLSFLRITVTTLLLLSVASAAVRAQGTGEPPAQPAVEKPALEKPAARAIPVAEINVRFVSTQSRLQKIQHQTERSADVARIEQRGGGFGRQFDAMEARLASRPIDELPLGQLDQASREWRQMRVQLQEWETVLAERLHQLEGLEKEIQEIVLVWQETRRVNQDLPQDLRQRIDRVVQSAEKVRSTVTARRNAVLALQSQVVDRMITVAGNIAAVDRASEHRRTRLFAIDSPPIWKVGRPGPADTMQVSPPSERTLRRGAVIVEYVEDEWTRVFVHALLTLLAAMGLYWMRKRASDQEEDDELVVSSLRILRRPLAAAVLVLWLLPQFVYPAAPYALYDAVAGLVLLASIPLVPALIPGRLRPVIYSMLTIDVLLWVLANADLSDFWARHLLLIVDIAGLFVILWWFARRKIVPYLPQAFRWIANPVRVLGAILGISLVANVAGAVGLASTLTFAVFYPAFLALTIYLAVHSIEGAVTLAILIPEVRLPHFIAHNRLIVQRRLGRLLRVAAVVIWSWYTLNTFVLFRTVWSGLLEWMTHKWTIGSASVSVADALLFFVVLWIATLVSRFARFVLREDVLPRLPLRRGIPETILLMVNYGIMAVGFVLALASLGLEVGQFALLAGALGVGVGFGLQTLVNNFVSGLILMFERPVQIGDVVEVGTLMGVVRHIGIRASVIRTFAGAEVIVPNGTLVSEQLINWTLSDQFRRIDVKVGAAYGTDPAVVIAALQRACDGDARIAPQPAPVALFLGFGESSLDFELRAWTSSEGWFVLSSDLKVRVYAELAKAGVTIPFPQRDIHVRTVAAPGGDTPTVPSGGAK